MCFNAAVVHFLAQNIYCTCRCVKKYERALWAAILIFKQLLRETFSGRATLLLYGACSFKRACVEYNSTYALYFGYWSHDSTVWAGYKRGVPWAEVFAGAFAMRTKMAAKFKLWKRTCTNSTLTHTIVYYRRPCHGHISKDSVYVYDGRYLATIFVLSYLGPPLLCDRKAERREIEYLHKRLGCSRREKVPFFSW